MSKSSAAGRPDVDFEPTLSPRFVAYVRDYMLDRDLDPDPIFRECGVESAKDGEFDTPLPVQQVAHLFELAAQHSNNPCMGMNMGQGYHYEASSLLILAMLAAPSVEEGLKCLSRYDQYVDTAIETAYDFSAPVAEFGSRLIINDDFRGDQINEYLMAFLMQALSNATRKRLPVRAVWLHHANDQNRDALEAFFGAPVTFAQSINKLVFDSDFLQERFFTSNPLLYEVLKNAMKTFFMSANEQSGFVDMVCREIIRCGADDSAKAEKIASGLAMSARTLRRRLADEGYSFQEAKNLARRKRAMYYLSHTNMPLSEIAFELGYSELSAFSRAFRNWVGETPQNYRDNFRHFLA
ncbi:MAG: AraC family transcriptional regulator [Pseudomonadota bacterium]